MEDDATGDVAVALKATRAREERARSSILPFLRQLYIMESTMTSKLSSYFEIPFTNSLNQTINPGDDVVAVTTGYGHNVSIFKAKYLGMRGDRCVLDAQASTRKFVNADGQEYSWTQEFRELPPVSYHPYDTYRQRNEEREALAKERRKGYEYKDFPYIRRTTLNLNRIFPDGTGLADIGGRI